MRGPNNVGRAVQTDPTLLRYVSTITEQKKCWELFAQKFNSFQTSRYSMQKSVKTVPTCNTQQCCVRLHRAVRSLLFIVEEFVRIVNMPFIIVTSAKVESCKLGTSLRFGQAKRASRERTPRGFAARSRVLARLVSLAQIGELARRLIGHRKSRLVRSAPFPVVN